LKIKLLAFSMRTLCFTLCLISALWSASAYFNEQGADPYITSHFSKWLSNNGYGSFNFDRKDIQGGSFGGKSSDSDKITKKPIIFFHGNSDRAYGNAGDEFNGFYDSINYFISQGYKESELYITTWGPADPNQASQQYHSYEYLNYLRNFVEAVLKYTNASKIDVIGHSMGVSLARKVIKGGTGTDTTTYDLGKSLASKVDTFLGISGANLGLVACYMSYTLPTCGKVNGFFPGLLATSGPSTYLNALNVDGEKEGAHIFTMLSTVDDLIMFGDKVWGKYTSQIPYEDDCMIYNNETHMGMKYQTVAEQYKIITTNKI
jgi:triacylglycerol lipase